MFPALRRSSYRRRLWLLTAGVSLFLAIVAGVELAKRSVQPDGDRSSDNVLALDFIAFYTGGHFAAEGRHRELFDLKAVKAFQDEIAAQNGVSLGSALGPWWNPPFYAWVFAPLSKLSFGAATAVWVGINALCAAFSCWLLVRLLPADSGWRTKALVPALMVLSIPLLHALSHGQNACTSLLIVTLVTTAWRANRPIVAGLIAGLMAYKPQHAVVLGGMLCLALGWRAMLGLAITGSSLLLITLISMPGSIGDFLRQMPRNIQFVQEQCVYLWERHTTLKAFWRLLLQGNEVGPSSPLTSLLTAISTAAVATLLLRLTVVARWLNPFDRVDRGTSEHRDRLIAATFLATPLLMPFYFDYDLLMLAVPAVLLASLQLRGSMTGYASFDRAIKLLAPIAYACLLINADFAERTRINLIVPLLLSLLLVVVWPRRQAEVATVTEMDRAPQTPPSFSKAA